MSATELVLSRRTEVTEERLRQHWRWSSRFAHMNDDRENAYLECYMPVVLPGVAEEMIARKRERETFEALQDLAAGDADARAADAARHPAPAARGRARDR